MLELGERTCLAQQALARLAVETLVRIEDLQRDPALELLVVSPIHIPHPALTDDLSDADVPKAPP
jgi:hypothetical protein